MSVTSPHWYSDIGGLGIEFGQWLIQQSFDTGITARTTKFGCPKDADLPFFTLIFSVKQLRSFFLTLAKAYLEARKQIFQFLNNVENRIGSNNFIHRKIAKI